MRAANTEATAREVRSKLTRAWTRAEVVPSPGRSKKSSEKMLAAGGAAQKSQHRLISSDRDWLKPWGSERSLSL